MKLWSVHEGILRRMLVSFGDFAPDIRDLLTTGIRLLKIEEKQQQPFLAMLSLTVYTVKEVCFIMVLNVRFTLVWVRPSGSTCSPATLLGTCSQKQVPNELVSDCKYTIHLHLLKVGGVVCSERVFCSDTLVVTRGYH